MATYINLDNLARYDANAKDRAGRLYADASAACWQKTEKAGAVTCVPAPETPLEPVVEFLFKETLPSGTKGPGNPSVIEGVESINVAGYGKNVIALPFFSNSATVQGVVWNLDNETGVVSANGTASADSNRFLVSGAQKILLKSGNTYFLSGSPAGGSNATYFMQGRKINLDGTPSTAFPVDFGSGAAWTVDEDCYFQLAIVVRSGVTVSNLVFKPQLELGSTATPFEPYTGAVYAISLPSTIYGGTLDVASGKLTVTHRMVEPSSGTVDISDRPALLPLEHTDTYGRTVTASADGTSLSVGSSGGQIVYRLANPETVYIDPVQVDSLPALGKTSPRVNTVYTDALNVQVGYAEHPAYTEELINNAILALGGDI